ncbi:MAG: sensor histidine kinase [Cytophagales bacterium]|nr:MAG: sensor histidine kinase [Cytophagales bacterium]
MNREILVFQQEKRKKTIEIFSKAGVIILLLSVLPDIYFRLWVNVLFVFIIAMIMIGVIVANRYNKINNIGTVLSIICNFGVFFACLTLGSLSRAYLFYIPIFISTFLIIDYKNKFILFFNLSHIILGIFIIDLFDLSKFQDKNITLEIVRSYGIFNTVLAMSSSVYFFILFIKEISDNEQHLLNSQNKFKIQNIELTKRNEELDRLIYSISHDIKSPLASITGLNFILKNENKQPQLDLYFDKLDNSIKKLKTFLENIILHYKNTKFEIQSDEIFFSDEIKNILENFGYHTNFNQIKINKTIEQSNAFVCDRLRIQTILMNLISNAVKYQNDIESQKRIDINIKVQQSDCIIEVSDNGIGIDAKIIDKIFDMFYRGTVKSDGSGLGLYILNETVKKLNGKVTIESEKNLLTKFKVVIPSNKNRK